MSHGSPRRCRGLCGKPLVRQEGESARAFDRRMTCGSKQCHAAYQAHCAAKRGSQLHPAPDAFRPIGQWPAYMAITKPFEDRK